MIDYLSGPMRGKPKLNFPLFDEVKAYDERCGNTVLSPPDHDREAWPAIVNQPEWERGDMEMWAAPDGFDLESLLAWDLEAIERADRIVLLPGWSKSKGAEVELKHAHKHGKRIAIAVKGQSTKLWYIQNLPLGYYPNAAGDDPEWEMFPAASPIRVLVSGTNTITNTNTPTTVPATGGNQGAALNVFVTKDSGERVEFDSGMVRDTQSGKPRYDLIPLEMLKRWAELLDRGAVKYGERNWEKARGQEELDRFQASAFRHLVQWLAGERDEDHAAAVLFNVAGYETIAAKMAGDDKVAESIASYEDMARSDAVKITLPDTTKAFRQVTR